MREISERYHMSWLDRRAGAPKLVSRGAGSDWGHEPHGMECAIPGDAVLVALHYGDQSSRAARSQPSLAGQTTKAALETTLRGKV